MPQKMYRLIFLFAELLLQVCSVLGGKKSKLCIYEFKRRIAHYAVVTRR